jgi:S-adenosylmethionine decarboxylase
VPSEGKPLSIGQEWLVDASGCRPAALRDAVTLELLFAALVRALELTALGPVQWHEFPGEGGITGLQMLSESHLAIHTFPEHGFAALSVYSCRERKSPDFEMLMERSLEATHVTVTKIERSAH